jgi:hypothetical protein
MAVSNFMIGAFRMGHCFGIPRMPPELPEYSRFSGLAARLTRGVDGYQQLGQPEQWSRG